MHLQIAADAPLLIKAAAGAALVLHIGGGTLGIASGFVAMAAGKGGRLHRVAGNVFFVSMLVMSGVGAIVAPLLPDRISAMMGLFTFYLTATAWLTVWRRPAATGVLEIGGLLLALAVVAGQLTLAGIGAASPRGLVDGQQPYALAVVVAGLAAMAGAFDLRMILRGGISGKARVARHLWRMSSALFIGSGSLFLGQPQVFPAFLRGSPALMIPALAPLVLLAFWMVRIRIGRGAVRMPSPA